MSETPTMITQPWIIAHERDDGTLEVMLAGPEGADECGFGLVIADIIGHVAAHFVIEKDEVMAHVQREIDHPTTKLSKVQHS